MPLLVVPSPSHSLLWGLARASICCADSVGAPSCTYSSDAACLNLPPKFGPHQRSVRGRSDEGCVDDEAWDKRELRSLLIQSSSTYLLKRIHLI